MTPVPLSSFVCLESGWPVNLRGSFLRALDPADFTGNPPHQFQYTVQKFLRCPFAPLYLRQFRFPARGEGGVGYFHAPYRFVEKEPLGSRNDVFPRITDIFAFEQGADDVGSCGYRSQSLALSLFPNKVKKLF